MIYLDHNSTTNIFADVKKTMLEVMDKPLNASAIHILGRLGRKIIEKARKQIGELVGISNKFRNYHITFTSSGTEANNLILSNFKDGEIFISAIEHASILAHTKFANNIHLIEVDKNGILSEEALIYHLAKSAAKRKLVSVIFANNETGVVQDIKKVTQIAHKYGALTHSDCVQAVGKIPVNLEELNLDFATISAHKIGGPVGAGALISKVEHHLTPHMIGGGQERGLRSGTENIAAIAGFGVAASIAKEEIELRCENLKNLRDYLETELLKTTPNIKIASKDTSRLPNTSLIINVGKKAETQIISFDLKNVAISSGSACSSGKVGASTTLAAMGFSDAEKECAIRVSLGYDTIKKDIDKFLEIYKEING